MDDMKYCKSCNEWKPFSQWGKNKKAKDGFQYYCKDCSLEMVVSSKEKAISDEVALLISEGIIRNIRIERIGASLLLSSCTSRMNDEFPCEWNNRFEMAVDLITKAKGFWNEWLRLTEAYDKENDESEKKRIRPSIDRIIENKSVGYRLHNVQPLTKIENTIKAHSQKYDIFNMSDNVILTEKSKHDVMAALAMDNEMMREVADGGLVSMDDGKTYLLQSRDRSNGNHNEILQNIANNSVMDYNGKMILSIPVRMPNGELASLEMPIKFDPRFVQAKVLAIYQ